MITVSGGGSRFHDGAVDKSTGFVEESMSMGLATKQDILAILHEHRAQLRSLGVRRLGLFGSFVRGEQRVDSDIDLLVEFEPGQKTFDHFMNLAVLLEDLLHRRIELVTTEALSPYIGPHIMSEVEYAALAA